MSWSKLGIPLLLIFCAGTPTTQTEANAGKEGFGVVIFCEDHSAINTWPNGVSLISLPSNQAKWKAMPDRIADVGPVAAGNTVAIVTDTWGTIYGFSKKTGKLLWKKEQHSNVLGSDGKYFYALRVEQDGSLVALSPDSGAVVWSVDVHQSGPAELLAIEGNLLFIDRFVVDLEKRAVVHKWSKYPYVSDISVSEDGEILVGDSSGRISTYAKNFQKLRTIQAGGVIVELAASGDNVVAAAYGDRDGNLTGHKRGVIDLWTRDGGRKWEIPLSSDAELDGRPFALYGGDVLIIEPGRSGNEKRLTSRKLSTGNLNWMTEDGNFFGPLVVCGDEVYVYESDRIRIFRTTDGAERRVAGGRPDEEQ